MKQFKVTTVFNDDLNTETTATINEWQAPTEVRKLARMLGDAFQSFEINVDDRKITYEWTLQ